MRARFLIATLLIVLFAVVGLGVPLALLARHEIFAAARENLRQEAASIAAGLEDQLDAGTSLNLTHYRPVLAGRRLIVNDSRGNTATSGPPLPGSIEQASVALSGATITVQANQGKTLIRAREVTGLVTVLAGLAVAAAVGLAITQARRLSAPLAHLAARADALGRGHFAATPIRSGIAEIDQISVELERSAGQIETMMSLQRDFASDAAHQLRTPLTGIGLRLEELVQLGTGESRFEAEQALIQVERLEGVISSLLARARGDATEPEVLEVGTLITEELAGWRHLYSEAGRMLSLNTGRAVSIRARKAHVVSILTCLLDNALRHGSGDVQIAVTADQQLVVIAVSDAGQGVPVDIRAHIFDRRFSGGAGSGIGLALARSLAEAESGQLNYRPGSPNAFTLTLPANARPGHESASPLSQRPGQRSNGLRRWPRSLEMFVGTIREAGGGNERNVDG